MPNVNVTIAGTLAIGGSGGTGTRPFTLDACADEDGADRNVSVSGEDDDVTNAVFEIVTSMADGLRDTLGALVTT